MQKKIKGNGRDICMDLSVFEQFILHQVPLIHKFSSNIIQSNRGYNKDFLNTTQTYKESFQSYPRTNWLFYIFGKILSLENRSLNSYKHGSTIKFTFIFLLAKLITLEIKLKYFQKKYVEEKKLLKYFFGFKFMSSSHDSFT